MVAAVVTVRCVRVHRTGSGDADAVKIDRSSRGVW